MILISILSWVSSHNAIGLVYANQFSDLATEVSNTTLCAGSMAYLGNGEVYVYNGTQWNKVGA